MKFDGNMSSNAVMNAIANQTSEYVNSTETEKIQYNEMEQSMDEYFMTE